MIVAVVFQDTPVRTMVDAMLPGDLGADLSVGAGDLVGHRFADVMQQAAHLGDLNIGAGLRRQHT